MSFDTLSLQPFTDGSENYIECILFYLVHNLFDYPDHGTR
jgi:hypothetical protein